MKKIWWLVVLWVVVWAGWATNSQASGVDQPILVSVTLDGTLSHQSNNAQISADGRYVAFISESPDLVPNDENDTADVFLRDTALETTIRVSLDADGEEIAGEYGGVTLSGDGQKIAFSTSATLVSSDTYDSFDIYLRDIATDALTWIPASTQDPDPTLSTDGQWLLLSRLVYTDKETTIQIFLYNTSTQTTELISKNAAGDNGNGYSGQGAISSDGRYIVFMSTATNLVADDFNEHGDVFWYDRVSGVLERVSINSWGNEGNNNSGAPEVSADGRFIVYQSLATNLVLSDSDDGQSDVYLFDRESRTTMQIPEVPLHNTSDGVDVVSPYISADGRYLAFHETLPGYVESTVFRYDRVTATHAELASGVDPVLNNDGSAVAYTQVMYDFNTAGLLTDVFVQQNIAPPTAPSATPTIALDTKLYLPVIGERRGLGQTRFVSITARANASSRMGRVAANGAALAFLSDASNLVPNDTNGVTDAFVWRTTDTGTTGTLERISVQSNGTQGDAPVTYLAIADDGGFVVFVTAAALVVEDTNGIADLYRRDLATENTTLVSVGQGGVPADGPTYDADISADGRWVLFSSEAGNLTPLPVGCAVEVRRTLYRRDMATGAIEQWGKDEAGCPAAPLIKPSLAADGQTAALSWLQFNGEHNEYPPHVIREFIYYYDGAALHLFESASPIYPCLLPTCFGKALYDPILSADGQWIVFEYIDESYSSPSPYLITAGLHGRHVLGGDMSTYFARTIGYLNGLVAGDDTPHPRIGGVSGDGSVVAFTAEDMSGGDHFIEASPFVRSDLNGVPDLFISYTDGRFERVLGMHGQQPDGGASEPDVSTNGRVIVFTSTATNLTGTDPNGATADIIVMTLRP